MAFKQQACHILVVLCQAVPTEVESSSQSIVNCINCGLLQFAELLIKVESCALSHPGEGENL